MLKRILISLIFVNIFVFAAGGIDKVNTLLENISTPVLIFWLLYILTISKFWSIIYMWILKNGETNLCYVQYVRKIQQLFFIMI